MDKNTIKPTTAEVRERIANRSAVIRNIGWAKERVAVTIKFARNRNASHAITAELDKAHLALTVAAEIADNELDAEWSQLESI
jgi:hypothetical protein